jgi:molecular chaperone HscB
MEPLTIRCRVCEAVCDGAAAPLRCPSCQAVLPPHPGATPFARLGLPLSLRVTDAEVESAWLQRSRQVHPDRFASRPAAERRAAAEQTAALNDARRALRTVFDRATWWVRHVGVAEPKLSQARLVWFMEAREEAEASPAGRARVVDDAVARFAVVDAELQALLATIDAAAPDAAALAKVAALLAEERTLARLAADLDGPVLLPSLDGR